MLKAQETLSHHTSENLSEEVHSMKGSSRLSIGLGHTHIQGRVGNETEWAPVASWALNFDYWLSNKWALGLQNDWILETFIVEHNNTEEFVRKNPLAVVPVVLYRLSDRFTVVAGVGSEITKEHNITMTRLGIEYGIHLPKNWEVGVALVWDGKWNYYNSWGLSLVFSKIWPGKHHLRTH